MSINNKIVAAKQSADHKVNEKIETSKDHISKISNTNQNGGINSQPHFADPEKNNTTDPKASLNTERDQNNPIKLSFADALKSQQGNNTSKPISTGNAERIALKEVIHARIFQTITYTPDQSPQGIERKVNEIQLAIQKTIGPGNITSIQYTGKGHYTVELKSKEQVQQLLQTGLQFPGEAQNAPLKPRRNQVLLITIKTDASTLNQEIYEELKTFGKIININYGYYNNNNQIRDGRRLIRIIPTIEIDKIPHTVTIDNRIHHLYFKGKTIKQRQQTAQATQELLADLDISDSEEMSQDEDMDEDEDEVEDKTERTDNETVKNDTNTTNPPGDEIKAEKPTEAKQTIKHLPQAKPRPKSDTNSKQTPQVKNNLQTQHSAPPSAEAQLTLLVPAETETGTDTKMDTEQTETEPNKTNNPQKNVKRKSVTTPTKETKLNPIKTKRKPNRTET